MTNADYDTKHRRLTDYNQMTNADYDTEPNQILMQIMTQNITR